MSKLFKNSLPTIVLRIVGSIIHIKYIYIYISLVIIWMNGALRGCHKGNLIRRATPNCVEIPKDCLNLTSRFGGEIVSRFNEPKFNKRHAFFDWNKCTTRFVVPSNR